MGAYLADTTVLPGGGDHRATLGDAPRDGFLDVDILARLHRPDRRQRMPMVGRRCADAVHIRVIEGLAHILDGLGLGILLVPRLIGSLLGVPPISIDHVEDVTAWVVQEGAQVA